MGATQLGITAYKIDGGFLIKRKILNIRTEQDTNGLYRFLLCRDATVLRKGEAIYSDEDDAWYAGYVLERQLISDGALYE